MCERERLDAVQDVRRNAAELTAACACLLIAQLYDKVIDEPVPAELRALLSQIDTPSDPPATR